MHNQVKEFTVLLDPIEPILFFYSLPITNIYINIIIEILFDGSDNKLDYRQVCPSSDPSDVSNNPQTFRFAEKNT